MIKIHLSKILGEIRWTQKDLAQKTGIRPNTINGLYNEYIDRIGLNEIDAICDALGCDVSDIFEYVPKHSKRNADYEAEDRRPQGQLNAANASGLEKVIETVLEKYTLKLVKTTTPNAPGLTHRAVHRTGDDERGKR